ncbi:MAG: DUF89 family protein [Pirellulales bacterium]|nr:DUF89 family protein [Pirellulales bacterium]
MKTFFDCIPCLVRQTLDSLRSTTGDERIQESILREVLRRLAEMDFQRPPAAMAQVIHHLVREATGNGDPHLEKKRRLNDMALKLYPEFARRVEQSADPLELAARLAIAGNVMDLGVKSNLDEDEMISAVDDCLRTPLDRQSVAEFAGIVDDAENILYLTDNSGEIVFDRLLIERMPREKLTVAVRGGPIINDATIEDARYVGLTEIVEVIDNGSDAPGTLLDDCGEEFRRRFERADLIVAKGQGNYETLADSPGPIYFLLRVKCPVIARDLNLPVGTIALVRSPCWSDAAGVSRK